MEITDRRVPYYNILILEICQRCCFEEAHDMIEEMRQFGCDPDSRTYNYLLSSLCKHDRTAEVLNVFREMQKQGLGKLDIAGHFYDMMVSRGLEPRLATFTTLIEGYFKSGQYEDAYNYVVASGDKFWHSGNRIYSFLADLYRRKGHLMTAAKILIEMMDKGLIPEFPVYMTITKRVYKCGGGQLARETGTRKSSEEDGSKAVLDILVSLCLRKPLLDVTPIHTSWELLDGLLNGALPVYWNFVYMIEMVKLSIPFGQELTQPVLPLKTKTTLLPLDSWGYLQWVASIPHD
ncbi:pentatricopeptide repeat-containing protein At4g19440, chloroplastic-like [Diospyros lotus]|uniref:pentatricopeptide repeat-containing protein At4g19440, chloroplastic-like n=1 Tax=Diospyros lotus TaxID=55363 RepID=UPI002253F5C9|nr:pentatricopeptide repeat-containing protein At4g19440, chloroplastic-like [Diospyros lotus]